MKEGREEEITVVDEAMIQLEPKQAMRPHMPLLVSR
jgi:hypothetical protein